MTQARDVIALGKAAYERGDVGEATRLLTPVALSDKTGQAVQILCESTTPQNGVLNAQAKKWCMISSEYGDSNAFLKARLHFTRLGAYKAGDRELFEWLERLASTAKRPPMVAKMASGSTSEFYGKRFGETGSEEDLRLAIEWYGRWYRLQPADSLPVSSLLGQIASRYADAKGNFKMMGLRTSASICQGVLPAKDSECINVASELAERLSEGWDSPKNYELAADLLSKCSDAGSMRCVKKLAGWHEAGKFVPKDLPKAFSLYRNAAELGDRGAQFLTASMCYGAVGTQKDVQCAEKWLERLTTSCADALTWAAYEKLAQISTERGDQAGAYYWYLLGASRSAPSFGGLKVSEFKAMLDVQLRLKSAADSAEKNLTSEQLLKAQRAAYRVSLPGVCESASIEKEESSRAMSGPSRESGGPTTAFQTLPEPSTAPNPQSAKPQVEFRNSTPFSLQLSIMGPVPHSSRLAPGERGVFNVESGSYEVTVRASAATVRPLFRRQTYAAYTSYTYDIVLQ